ncbi:hypothetical protein ACS0TY_003076 [Phlomoides rotata]
MENEVDMIGANLPEELIPEIPFEIQLDCPSIESDQYRRLVGSCNGLVCLSFNQNDIILWNPTTRKSKQLPYTPPILKAIHTQVIMVFGYDELHDDYKVVEFSNRTMDGASNFQINVYSRRSNSWKVLTNWPGGDASSSMS